MLDVSVETVCYLIQKARAFHVKEEVVIPEEPLSATSDWALQVLADHKDDPTYTEFITTVRDLEPDQQTNLVALMWIGRGDFDTGEWDAALRRAKSEWTDHTAEYLITKPLLADYLEAGLEGLGHSCNE